MKADSIEKTQLQTIAEIQTVKFRLKRKDLNMANIKICKAYWARIIFFIEVLLALVRKTGKFCLSLFELFSAIRSIRPFEWTVQSYNSVLCGLDDGLGFLIPGPAKNNKHSLHNVNHRLIHQPLAKTPFIKLNCILL